MNRHLGFYRNVARLEEAMIRAAMPRTFAVDIDPLPGFAAPTRSEVLASRPGSRLVRPLTFTIAEVARGN